MKPTTTERPWQLDMFGRSLKKQQKLDALLSLTGPTSGQNCLLITCGDNNGALNYYFREQGGNWTWADLLDDNLNEMGTLLGESVHFVLEDCFPFADNKFDCAVAIDTLEHLADDQLFLTELRRVLREGGTAVVTVPNGDPHLLANRIKWRVGMTPNVYGHTRAGYTTAELATALEQAGFQVATPGGYSRFFTEMLELIVNFAYVFVLSRTKGSARAGHIAPTSAGELKRHGVAYRLYSLLFPLLLLLSKLDWLLPASGNGAVIVRAQKPDGRP